MPSLLDPLHSIPIAVVDVETTGAGARWGDRIIEIGIVRYEAGRPAARYEALIDPRRRISAGVSALTGITQAMVNGLPTFRQRMHEFLPFLRGALIVGHNVGFDLAFLAAELRRAHTSILDALCSPIPAPPQADSTDSLASVTAAAPNSVGPPTRCEAASLFDLMGVAVPAAPPAPRAAPATDRLARPHVVDTVRIARRRFGRGGNALGRLSRRLGIYPRIAHRALADAEATGQVLERLLEPMGGFAARLVDVLGAQGGAMRLEAISREPEPLPMEILDAIEAGREVKMIYMDRESRRSERQVLPLRIRRRRGTAVLLAHCKLRNEERAFKLDRIVTMEELEVASEEISG